MKRAQAVAIDVVAVLLFAVVGRSAHAESNDLVGVVETAWPFLAGLAVASLLAAALRHREAATATPSAVIVWAGTVVLGLVLRVAGGAGAPWPFVIVTAVTLAILLIGWRVVARAVRRVRRAARRPVRVEQPARRHERSGRPPRS